MERARVGEIKMLGGNWVKGTLESGRGLLRFEAKIYTEPSDYGIENGRVSKLYVTKLGARHPILHYERGWDGGERKVSIWKPIVNALEDFAQRPEFKAGLEH